MENEGTKRLGERARKGKDVDRTMIAHKHHRSSLRNLDTNIIALHCPPVASLGSSCPFPVQNLRQIPVDTDLDEKGGVVSHAPRGAWRRSDTAARPLDRTIGPTKNHQNSTKLIQLSVQK